MAMNLRNLDFKNAGSWPKPFKAAACAVVGVVILLMGWQFILSGQRDTLASLQNKETTLRADFEKKAGRAANLEPLTSQLEQMEDVLAQQLRQLPTKTEMPDLIVDVSRVALNSGIQTELFQPDKESLKEFYAEKPIQLRMVGTYHQFGDFVSGVASLPRVVIMSSDNLSLKPRAVEGKPGLIVMEGTVKTYRSLDEDEMQVQEKLAEEARKKAKASKAKASAAAARASQPAAKKGE